MRFTPRQLSHAPGLIIRVVDFPNLDGIFIEIVEQARIDAHLAKVFAKRLPVGATAADRAVMNANHSIPPDIGCRLARNCYLVRRIICDTPREPAAERAVTVCDPRRLAWQLYLHVAAMTAPVNTHGLL